MIYVFCASKQVREGRARSEMRRTSGERFPPPGSAAFADLNPMFLVFIFSPSSRVERFPPTAAASRIFHYSHNGGKLFSPPRSTLSEIAVVRHHIFTRMSQTHTIMFKLAASLCRPDGGRTYFFNGGFENRRADSVFCGGVCLILLKYSGLAVTRCDLTGNRWTSLRCKKIAKA